MDKQKKIIKLAREEYLRSWKGDGGKTTIYSCGHCRKKIETPQPGTKDVGPKGFWDSAHQCLHCFNVNFVCVYPTGRTTVKALL